MIDNSPRLISTTINNLRFPLIVLVVAIHVYYVWPTPSGMWDYAFLLIRNGVARTAVPIFFLISGYLLFHKEGLLTNGHRGFPPDFSHTMSLKIKKRAVTLLVPYLLWNLPGLIFAIKNDLNSDFTIALLKNYGFFFTTGNNSFEPIVPIDCPLWYVRDLMVMVVASPLVFILMRNKWVGLAANLAMSFAMCMQLVPSYTLFTMGGLLFFSIGIWFALHPVDFLDICHSRNSRVLCIILWILYVFVLYLDITLSTPGAYSTPWHGIGILTGSACIILTAGFCSLKGEWQISRCFGASTFFIYCVHYYICTYFIYPFYRSVTCEGWSFLALYIADIVLVTAASYGCYWIATHFFPNFCRVLTGTRQ